MLTLKAWLFFGRRKAVLKSSVTALSGHPQGGGKKKERRRGGKRRRRGCVPRIITLVILFSKYGLVGDQ